MANFSGDHSSWGPNFLGTKFLGDQISQGPNFLGTKFPGDQISRGPKRCGDQISGAQISWGPKNSGDQMGLGTNSVTALGSPFLHRLVDLDMRSYQIEKSNFSAPNSNFTIFKKSQGYESLFFGMSQCAKMNTNY